MKKVLFLTLLLVALVAVNASATGYGDLEVRVSDSVTSEAIAGATVKIQGVTLTTDANGECSFEAFLAGTHIITIKADGYASYKGEVLIPDGDDGNFWWDLHGE